MTHRSDCDTCDRLRRESDFTQTDCPIRIVPIRYTIFKSLIFEYSQLAKLILKYCKLITKLGNCVIIA